MTPERYQQAGRLYHAALELSPDERAAYLEEACGGDEQLHREVETLLAAHEKVGDYFAAPAVEVAAGLVAGRQPSSLVGERLSHYRVIKMIGAGGMGEVYLGEDTRLGRKVALKLLPKEFTEEAERVRRFEQEARATSSLNHPNIATIYEVGQVEKRHFIAAEYIEGRTLRERLTAVRMEVREALEVGVQIASALEAAHEAGIVHRDIKPENVMVRRDGLVKVLDFGLAKLSERRDRRAESEATTEVHTTPGMVLGTVSYMSPEQARGERLDHRTDIFGYPNQQEETLMMANVDGSGEQRLTTRKAPDSLNLDNDRYCPPAWSPDGKTIACFTNNNVAGEFYQSIIGVRVGDGTEISLSSQRWRLVSGLAWLAGNSGLLITGNEAKTTDLVNHIWKLSYPDGDTRRITSDANIYRGMSLNQR